MLLPTLAVVSGLGLIGNLAIICMVVGVLLLILGAFGITAGYTPYGTHGGITLMVIGIILYVVAAIL